jgi:hypothetical protein
MLNYRPRLFFQLAINLINGDRNAPDAAREINDQVRKETQASDERVNARLIQIRKERGYHDTRY